MSDRLRREQEDRVVALATSVANTPRISLADYAGGAIRIPSGSSITSLTFHGSETDHDASTYAALYDAQGDAVTMTVAADRIYALPEAVFGCAALKIVANAAGQAHVSVKG